MKLGMAVGKILIFIGVILLFCALYIANRYGMGGTTYVYFGMSLGAIALGTICYEVGKCSDALVMIRYEVKTSSVDVQNIKDLNRSILKVLAEK